MKIRMIGIDYHKASVAQREVFAFTLSQAEEGMHRLLTNDGVSGCVIVSTCNRTEIWITEDQNKPLDLAAELCEIKKIDRDVDNEIFTIRENPEAVRHLFETACGIKSQVWGEDQILSQIKAAIETARKAGSADEILEKLFQTAITSAKKIKTEVRLTAVDVSIASRALEIVREYFDSLNDIKCLVIGNGEIGKIMSELLVQENAHVTITKRKYKNGTSVVPEGCHTLAYEKRMDILHQVDLVVSATSSPHYTVKLEDINLLERDPEKKGKKVILIDLAVPRDIDPALAELPNVVLLDSDSFGSPASSDSHNESLVMAQEIIAQFMEEFLKWKKTREYLPVINSIALGTSEIIKAHLAKELSEFSLTTEEKKALEYKLDNLTTKAVKNILFRIKDSMDVEQWEACFRNLKTAEIGREI